MTCLFLAPEPEWDNEIPTLFIVVTPLKWNPVPLYYMESVMRSSSTLCEVRAMRPDILVDTVEALVKSDNRVNPPYRVYVPYGTYLDAQFIDGDANDLTLKERILRIENVKAVKCGSGNGTYLETYYEGSNEPK